MTRPPDRSVGTSWASAQPWDRASQPRVTFQANHLCLPLVSKILPEKLSSHLCLTQVPQTQRTNQPDFSSSDLTFLRPKSTKPLISTAPASPDKPTYTPEADPELISLPERWSSPSLCPTRAVGPPPGPKTCASPDLLRPHLGTHTGVTWT